MGVKLIYTSQPLDLIITSITQEDTQFMQTLWVDEHVMKKYATSQPLKYSLQTRERFKNGIIPNDYPFTLNLE